MASSMQNTTEVTGEALMGPSTRQSVSNGPTEATSGQAILRSVAEEQELRESIERLERALHSFERVRSTVERST